MDKNSRIIIVGAGVFGLSTAYELGKRGFRNTIVLDRHVPPVLHTPGPMSLYKLNSVISGARRF